MVTKAVNNIQDIFLNNARKTKTNLTIHLLNGFQIKGIVKGFDNFTVILECDDKNMMLIYKHSISTITPEKPISFSNV
ncbi:MAG: RNA chaperone Hfq [Clostridium sp.]